MKSQIIIFGYGFEGVKLYRELANHKKYEIIGFADNSPYKQHKSVGEYTILSVSDLINLKSEKDFSVIIAANKWFVIGEELEKHHIKIEGIYRNGEICKYDRMYFERLDLSKKIVLYAGDIADDMHMSEPNLYGLSINKADSKHILHDITNHYPLPDNSIYSYQAEDVLEHIAFEKLVDTINEIYRILHEGGLLRICLPDYYSAYLRDISMRDEDGNIRETSLYGDDLWLKTVELIWGICTHAIGEVPVRVIKGSQDEALYKENAENRRNNEYLEALQRYFNVRLADLF